MIHLRDATTPSVLLLNNFSTNLSIELPRCRFKEKLIFVKLFRILLQRNIQFLIRLYITFVPFVEKSRSNDYLHLRKCVAASWKWTVTFCLKYSTYESKPWRTVQWFTDSPRVERINNLTQFFELLRTRYNIYNGTISFPTKEQNVSKIRSRSMDHRRELLVTKGTSSI